MWGCMSECGGLYFSFVLFCFYSTAPQCHTCIDAQRADESGRQYYEFEFTVDTGRYQRHSLAVVTVGNGANSRVDLCDNSTSVYPQASSTH